MGRFAKMVAVSPPIPMHAAGNYARMIVLFAMIPDNGKRVHRAPDATSAIVLRDSTKNVKMTLAMMIRRMFARKVSGSSAMHLPNV